MTVWPNQIHPPYFELPNHKNRDIRDDDRSLYNRVQRSRLAVENARALLKFVDKLLGDNALIAQHDWPATLPIKSAAMRNAGYAR